MPEFDAAIIGNWIGTWMWPFVRISAFVMAAPILGTQLVQQRVRLTLALLITALLVPALPTVPLVDALSVASLVLIAQQLVVGLALAFMLQMLLQVFSVAGQIIAMQMGLGFASMIDPANGVSVTVLSQFHLLLATLLFLAMDGHLAMLEVLAASFTVLPVSAGLPDNDFLWVLSASASWLFAGALLMALPAIASLLIINCSLGIVTRAAPQLNIFSIGFPFMLVIGIAIVWITIGGYLPHFDRLTEEVLVLMGDLLR